MTRVLVCGGRNYTDVRVIRDALDRLHEERGISLIIHGACRGADSVADMWARARGIEVSAYPISREEWASAGRAAGPLRNATMLADSKPDLCVAFPGDKGTRDMVAKCKAAKVAVRRYGGDK